MQTITRNFILLLSFHVRFESVFCGVLGRHTLATLSLAYSRGAFEQAGEISEETGSVHVVCMRACAYYYGSYVCSDVKKSENTCDI